MNTWKYQQPPPPPPPTISPLTYKAFDLQMGNSSDLDYNNNVIIQI